MKVKKIQKITKSAELLQLTLEAKMSSNQDLNKLWQKEENFLKIRKKFKW